MHISEGMITGGKAVMYTGAGEALKLLETYQNQAAKL